MQSCATELRQRFFRCSNREKNSQILSVKLAEMGRENIWSLKVGVHPFLIKAVFLFCCDLSKNKQYQMFSSSCFNKVIIGQKLIQLIVDQSNMSRQVLWLFPSETIVVWEKIQMFCADNYIKQEVLFKDIDCLCISSKSTSDLANKYFSQAISYKKRKSHSLKTISLMFRVPKQTNIKGWYYFTNDYL